MDFEYDSGHERPKPQPTMPEVTMHSFLTFWIPLFNALLTPAIALLAVVIGFFQWRTAHQEVVIDLFDRRMKIYTNCQAILHKMVALAAADFEDGKEFQRICADAEFLFGEEVFRHLKNTENLIFDLETSQKELKGTLSDQDRKDFEKKKGIATTKIREFHEYKFRSLLRPYMRLAQRSQC